MHESLMGRRWTTGRTRLRMLFSRAVPNTELTVAYAEPIIHTHTHTFTAAAAHHSCTQQYLSANPLITYT